MSNKFKRRVRERMEREGILYSEAFRREEVEPTKAQPDDEVRALREAAK